jgi:hypothetical protein
LTRQVVEAVQAQTAALGDDPTEQPEREQATLTINA